jgi:predicted O-methyltransferase YrrM
MPSQVASISGPGAIDRYWDAAGRVVRRLVNKIRVRPAAIAVDVSQATLNAAEQSLLRDLVEQASRHQGPLVEIGTLIGATTTRMALWKSPRQSIITVDNYCWNPWRLSPDLHHALAAQVLFSTVASNQVEHVRMDKGEFFRTYNGPAPALVFLDAWHTYEETKADIQWARRVGASIICGHDYCEQFPGVIQAVDEFGGPAQLRDRLWSL